MTWNPTRVVIAIAAGLVALVIAVGAIAQASFHAGASQAGTVPTASQIFGIARTAAAQAVEANQPKADPRPAIQEQYFGTMPKLPRPDLRCQLDNVSFTWGFNQEGTTLSNGGKPITQVTRTESDGPTVEDNTILTYGLTIDTLGHQLIWSNGAPLSHVAIAAVNYAGLVIWSAYPKNGETQITLPPALTRHGDWALRLTADSPTEGTNPQAYQVPGCRQFRPDDLATLAG